MWEGKRLPRIFVADRDYSVGRANCGILRSKKIVVVSRKYSWSWLKALYITYIVMMTQSYQKNSLKYHKVVY